MFTSNTFQEDNLLTKDPSLNLLSSCTHLCPPCCRAREPYVLVTQKDRRRKVVLFYAESSDPGRKRRLQTGATESRVGMSKQRAFTKHPQIYYLENHWIMSTLRVDFQKVNEKAKGVRLDIACVCCVCVAKSVLLSSFPEDGFRHSVFCCTDKVLTEKGFQAIIVFKPFSASLLRNSLAPINRLVTVTLILTSAQSLRKYVGVICDHTPAPTRMTILPSSNQQPRFSIRIHRALLYVFLTITGKVMIPKLSKTK